ncbi:MAG: hypothetical protein ACYCPP_09505 [Nitrososphaerales archaeon]
MRIAYGEGVVVAILLPFVLFFLGQVTTLVTFFLVFLFFGVWSIVSSVVLAKKQERNIYLTWGLILSCASTIFVISISYAIALTLISIIASLFIFVAAREKPKPPTRPIQNQ